MESFKKDINNSLKEKLKNASKQGESLEELRENITQHVKELKKVIQDLKMEVETIKKSQRETEHRKPRNKVRSHGSKH